MCTKGQINREDVRTSGVGKAVTTYMNPKAAPVATTRLLAKKTQAALKDIYAQKLTGAGPAPEGSGTSSGSASQPPAVDKTDL